MAKLKEEKEKMEKEPRSRGSHTKIIVDKNEESSRAINQKHFGHVSKTTNALHKSDPYCGSHKL